MENEVETGFVGYKGIQVYKIVPTIWALKSVNITYIGLFGSLSILRAF